jgi:hypothetical protein
MKFALVAILLPVTLRASAASVYVSWDAAYSNPDRSIDDVTCSYGLNGLSALGHSNLSSLPSFPYLGGIPGVSFNSTLCGSCWAVKYAMPNHFQNTVYITAVDLASTFNLSPEAFDDLTGGTGFAAGTVHARAVQVAASKCGL